MSEAESNGCADDLLPLVAKVVAAYASGNSVAADELPTLIESVHRSLAGLAGGPAGSRAASLRPAVPVRRSIEDDSLVCLEDGKRLKMLKRYLRTKFGLTPEAYRAKWGLPADYPMVAPNYAKQRSRFAKKIGLGRRAPAAEAA